MENNLFGNSTQFKEKFSVKLNPFTLSFPHELEKDFLDYYYQNSIAQINISVFIGAFFFATFLIFDFYLIPELFYQFLFLRTVVAWIVMFSALLIIKKSKNKKITQPALSLSTILIGTIDIAFIVIASPKLDSLYYVGLILIYFWAFVFLKLRFLWAVFTGIVIFLIYSLAVFKFLSLSPDLLFVSTSYLFAANLVGMAIAYTLEYNSRKDFFHNLVLKKSLETNFGLTAKINENEKTIGMVEEELTLRSKAIESAANSILIINKKGNIIYANPAFSVLTGYSLEEALGKNPKFLKSDKHDSIFYKNLWSTILKGQVWSGEIINKKKNGQLYYEEMVITPVSLKNSDKFSHFIAIKQDITFRKQMEDELLESEKRLRSLFENAVMGIYRSTPSGEILMANDALIKMLGFESLEELKNWRTACGGYSDPKQRDVFIQLIDENGFIFGFESEWIKKDGSKIYIRESARKSVESGKTIYEGTVEDITLRKLAEVEIVASKERLQKVFDNINDAIIIHDLNGNIVDINNKVLDLYNISKEDALKLKIKDLSSSENPLDNVTNIWKEIIDKDKTFKFEWKAMRPFDKYVFDVEVYLSKITLEDNNYILGCVRDISEQKEAHKKLLTAQKAVEMSDVPIFWLNKDAKIIYVNNATAEMLGYSVEELTNMKIPEIDPNWNQEYWDNVGFPRLVKQRVDHFETAHITKSGTTIPIEVNSTIIEFEGDKIVVAIVTNLTERKKAAETLIAAKERAEKSEKLKSEFLAGMSHEIRTPINTILNFISLIKSDLGNNISDDLAFSFEMIDSGSRRLIRTIDSILNMSQLQSGAYETKFEVFSIVDDVLKNLYSESIIAASKKGIKLELFVNAKNTKISADLYTVAQLFINLIDNAIKYTKEGTVKISVLEEENHIVIKITDTGIGISEEFLPTLFEPFLQEEMGYTRSFEGTGLGLALVKRYLEINDGTIDVESKKGVGSTFTIRFLKLIEKEKSKYKAAKIFN